MTTNANRVQCTTREEYERLLAHPASTAGWFNPTTGKGEVLFPTQQAAQAARREQ